MSTTLSPSGRAVIYAGGRLGTWALEIAKEGDYLIGADRGAAFLVRHGLAPDLALGDFDSVTERQLHEIAARSAALVACDAVDKDWTDSELALREALERGYTDIVLAGALGTRFDHGLANVHLLRQAYERGGRLVLADEHNEIRLCADELELAADPRFPYVSLLPLGLEATGITLEGFRYPLRDATLKLGWSLGISNELAAESGRISVRNGLLLVIRSRD
ncbi:thiamine diphosphokinase [Paenibacillaceae bacterium WGS1546]|uniref:thiamine diphosphokinase n=1 Tax=Cohnella sp. WGS1546 TaxID=3366810 RepID=UPI00372D7D0C